MIYRLLSQTMLELRYYESILNLESGVRKNEFLDYPEDCNILKRA